MEAREHPWINGRRGEHQQHDDEAAEEFPENDLAIAHRIRPEELERAELALLGEEPHGEERDERQEQALDVEKLPLPEPARQIHAAHQHEEAQGRVEEVAREDEEYRRERVEEERGEVELELLHGEREHVHTRRSPASTSSRKM